MELEKLKGLDVHPEAALEKMDEMTYYRELEKFLGGYDFMKLGQSIHRGQWETAMMLISRMERTARSLGLSGMERNLREIRNTVMQRNAGAAKNLLALAVLKRIRIHAHLKEEI